MFGFAVRALMPARPCSLLWLQFVRDYGGSPVRIGHVEERDFHARHPVVNPGPEALRTILERCGIVLDAAQVDSLWRYHRMLREANASLNLTRIHNFENMVLKHYVDSLLVLRHIDLPATLVDMGTGPGLPGIPLKIARPEVQMILAEPRGARVAFLREVCQRLGLKGIEVYGHKVGPDFPATAGGVISRAVGPICEGLDRVAGWLSSGSKVIFMKGPGCDPEVEEAVTSRGELFRFAADHAYTIPGTTHDRRLLVFERLKSELAPGPAVRLPSRSARALGANFAGRAREIESAANPTFQQCRDVLGGAGIRKRGEAILSGARIRSEMLAKYPDRVIGWLTGPEGLPPPDDSLEWLRFSAPLFKQIDVVGTHDALLLVQVPEIPRWSDSQPWPDGCTVFVPFQDPENVGAVIRSAAAFGAARVVLLREAAHPFLPRAGRAAGPALFQMRLEAGPPLAELQVEHAPLLALDLTGPELEESPFPLSFGLVLGTEGRGLPETLRGCERRRIPIAAGVDSLNAAAAAAIALYAWATRRPLS
jgi:16S rRNA (guanine527-N7)-methyltransferase